jgi:hypothetical protein
MKIKTWIWMAPLGLILIGAGISMAIDAGREKALNHNWFYYGTFSLIILNSGLCVFGDAVYRRTKN